jgi:hypothetical protein
MPIAMPVVVHGPDATRRGIPPQPKIAGDRVSEQISAII